MKKSVGGMGKGKIIYEPYNGAKKMTQNVPSLPSLAYDVDLDPLVVHARKVLPNKNSLQHLRLAQKRVANKIKYEEAMEKIDIEAAAENAAKAGLLEMCKVHRSFPTNMNGLDSDAETAPMDNQVVVDLNAELYAEAVEESGTDEATDAREGGTTSTMDDDDDDDDSIDSNMSIGISIPNTAEK
jgi:hypothetical protein